MWKRCDGRAWRDALMGDCGGVSLLPCFVLGGGGGGGLTDEWSGEEC